MIFSNKESLLAWAAGLFEGEGTFRSDPGLSVVIEMTDEDVLKTFHDNFGGSFLVQKPRKNFKPTWKWALHGESAYNFIISILPFLHSRRALKAKECLSTYDKRIVKQENERARVIALRNEIKSLQKLGLKHTEIAIKLNIDRSYVTHVINGKYD